MKAKSAFSNEELGLEPGERPFTKEEARKACEEWMAEASKRPGAQAALRRVRARQCSQ